MGSVFLRKDTCSWVIKYKNHLGKIKVKTIGKKGAVTKTMAKEIMKEIERKVKLKEYDMYETKIPTLEEFSTKYIDYGKDVLKKRSWFRDKTCLDNLNYFFNDRKLSQITIKDIDIYKEKRLLNVKPSTIDRELAVLRNLFNLAKKWNKFFGNNPVSQSGLINEENIKERILTKEEEIKLLENSPSFLKNIIICALNTGMRKNEIITLEWMNVDLDNNLVIIELRNNKSKKLKRIPLNSKLRQLLLELKLKSGGNKNVFLNSKGKPYSGHDSLNRAFYLALSKSKIEGLRFHDLRHTAATRMVENGANIVTVSKILGHSDIKTTMRYAHPENTLHDAVESLANIN